MKWRSASDFRASTGVATEEAHFQTDYAGRTVFFHAVTLGRLSAELPLAVTVLLRALTAHRAAIDWVTFDGPTSTVIVAAERMLMMGRSLATAPATEKFKSSRSAFLAVRSDPSADERAKRSAISDLAEDARRFAESVKGAASSDGSEVVVAAGGLPSELMRYFGEASDCFSVQLDGLGVFSALRGLEATLRQVAEKKHVVLERVSKSGAATKEALHEADLRDIIEAANRLRWADTGLSVVDKPTRSLLQTLRDHRNAMAHPRSGIDDDGREVAILAAKTAVRLWLDGTQPRRRLKAKIVRKEWQ